MKKYMPNLKPTLERMETAFVVERTNEIEDKLKHIIVSFLALKDRNKEAFLNELKNKQPIVRD